MAMMIRKGNNGGLFQVKVIDCQQDVPFNLDDVVDQFIVFYKPDGKTFEKRGRLVEDPDHLGEYFIQYVNNIPEESIFDLLGNWEYTGKVELNSGDMAEASTRLVFWVV